MEFSALAGNDRLKEQLSQQESGRGLAHAYIISGPTGSGRHTLARLLAAAMVCTSDSGGRPCGKCSPCKKIIAGIHPDFEIISGPEEGKPITVDQIRALRSDAYIRPNEGDRKIYLLEGADQMNASAQNAMLKLLEEGPGYAVFLLLAENGGGLLQTVRSRCEELVLSPVSVVQCQSWLKDRFPQKKLGGDPDSRPGLPGCSGPGGGPAVWDRRENQDQRGAGGPAGPGRGGRYGAAAL